MTLVFSTLKEQGIYPLPYLHLPNPQGSVCLTASGPVDSTMAGEETK